MPEAATTCSATCIAALPVAVIPSIVWLLFFVAQDKHREKARNLITVFLWGVFIAVPVVFVEILLQDFFFVPFAAFAITPFLISFVAIAFVEEIGKYWVVRAKAVPRAFFDEPQDAIIYMITAALGFAAIENVAYAFNVAPLIAQHGTPVATAVIQITALRGLSATFLHVVASGTLGYFLALSLENRKERRKFLYTGFALATVLHGVYNNFIMDIEQKFLESGTGGQAFGVSLIAALLIISGTIILVGLRQLAKARFYNTNTRPPAGGETNTNTAN